MQSIINSFQLFAILRLDYLVRVLHQFAHQTVGGKVGADANPVFRAHIVRCHNGVVTLCQKANAIRLALDGHNFEVVDIEKAEDVLADIERQHALRRLERPERHLFFDISAQRKAEIAQIFDIHNAVGYRLVEQNYRYRFNKTEYNYLC